MDTTHTTTLDFYRDDVADALVESVASATLNALTRGTARLRVGAELPHGRRGEMLRRLHLDLDFYALNDREAQRTVQVVVGAIHPLVLGSVILPIPERTEAPMPI